MALDIDSDHPGYQNIKNIEHLVQNGSKLTAQILGYAREGKYQTSSINLNALIKDTSETFSSTRKEISVHLALSPDLFGIIADQGQIEQTLLNLYVNAAEAMPLGGKIFIETINISHNDITEKKYKPKPGNYILLTVRDTGVGMDGKTMERIFEPFFTTKGLALGTGLGLASSYGIIKGHGGYIDVDSKPGNGTTFSIYLPATNERVALPFSITDKPIRGDETVLLVDDEDIILDAGEQMLKSLGYKVMLAKNGLEALRAFRRYKGEIAIVLLDMVMPGMGGGDVFDRMKEIDQDVKVLLSSGYSIDGKAAEILSRGCDSFIQKPFNLRELSGKLREVLDKA